MIPSWIKDLLPNESPLIFLATGFLIAIHHLIKLIETRNETDGIVVHSTFPRAFQQMVSHETTISDLSILAYTSQTWFEQVRLSTLTIGNLRLLLFYDEAFLAKNVDEDPNNSTFRIERMTKAWKRLLEDGKIKALEIRRIRMAPPLYFGIVNQEKGMFGFLWPRGGISGLEPRQAVFLYSSSEYSTTMLRHSKLWFNAMWEIADIVNIS